MNEQELKEYRANVISSLEEEITHYQNLIKLTRHSRLKESHTYNLKFMQELLDAEKADQNS
ncbi:hypothetical protein [Gottfriedia acidiceleris]|uniref:hypothetical protein n=1 Tax=Gottfriedia acidiceleris TaxID=371036 RepID=UPI003D255E90